MSGLTKLPQGNTAYDWSPPPEAGPNAPSATPSSIGDQFGAQVTTLDRMLSNPDAMPPGRMPPVAPNPWRDIQSFVGKTMAVVTAPIDMLNQAVASLTFPLAMMLPAFPAVRLFTDLTLTIHIHPHPPTFGIPIPAVGPCVAAGACTVLINGLPAARSGDFGLSAWCGGYFPIFEVVTGSSHCMVQGARPARITDITLHCSKTGGLGAIGIGMMLFTAAMDAVGVMAATTEQANALAADQAAAAEAAGVEAAAQSVQMAADIAAMALSVMMGMDPAPPPAIGMFITGSPNVIIGGFPMPGWMVILKGLLKILRLIARAIQLLLPKGSKLANALCKITGHPVDVATGRVFTSQTDFEFPWRIPVRFERYYDSSSIGYEGPLGVGWTHSYDIHLWRDAAQNMVILRNEEGHLEGYAEIAVGSKSVHPLYRSTLERPGEREYHLTRPDGVKYIFSAVSSRAGGPGETTPLRLTHIQNRNGCNIDLLYDRNGLAQIDDHTGRRIILYYVTLKNGRVRLSELRLELEPPLDPVLLASFAYDDEGRLTAAFDVNLNPYRYAYDGNLLVRETNRNGLTFHFEYEGAGEEARCVHTWGDGGIYERRLTYNFDVQSTTATGSRGAIWTYEWNEAGLVTKTVDPLGNTKTFLYDDSYRKIAESQPDGSVSQWKYDEHGHLTAFTDLLGRTAQIAYDASGNPVQSQWPDGSITRRGYDERGNIAWTENGLGGQHRYDYDQYGNLVQLTNAVGEVDRFEYNHRGDLTKWRDPDGAETLFVHNPRGRLGALTAPGGLRTEYGYDIKDRLIQVRFPDGTRNRYRYDAEDNLTGFTRAGDYLTEYHYGGFNKVTERVDPTGHRLRYLYDTEENLVALVNQRKESYRFEYDAAGRCIEEESFDGAVRRFGYDRNGRPNRLEEVPSDGAPSQVTLMERNTLGELLAKRLPSGAVHRFEYDPMGRLVKADTPLHSVAMVYDVAGRLIEEKQDADSVRFEYDAEGRRKQRISTCGHTVEYEFSASNLLLALTVTGERSKTVSAQYRYNALGMLAEQLVTGGARESFEYDAAGRLTRQEVIATERSISRAYRYSALGTLAAITDSRWGRQEFAHDPMGKLSAILTAGAPQQRFDFDPAENLVQAGDHQYRIGKGDRLEEKNSRPYRYNGFGDLIERPPAGDHRPPQFFVYTDQHRLESVSDGQGAIAARFEYDALGRRVKKTAEGRESRYIWDGGVLLGEIGIGLTHEYVFFGFTPVLRTGWDGAVFYHNDHLGTPRSLTDEHGNMVWEGKFHVWGKEEAESGTVHQPIGRPGQYIDQETGLAYNLFRYYDPDDGRYLTKDPLHLAGGTNLYAYSRDPLLWADVLGLEDTLPLEGWRFSQTSAGGSGRYDTLRPSMEQNGWIPGSKPVDVVRLENGTLVGFDNTRPLIGQELGWENIPATIHPYDERLPASEWTAQDAKFFGKEAKRLKLPLSDPPTWGEINAIRTKRNGLPPEGTTERPTVRRPGCT